MTDSKWKRSGTWIYIERRDRVVQQSLVAKMCYLGSIGEQEQLADFIVRACNVHDGLLAACELHWRNNPDTDCKEVYRSDGEVVFTSDHTGLSGAAEAERFIADQRNAAVAKARGE